MNAEGDAAIREVRLIDAYWQRMPNTHDTIAVLREYARYRIERPADWDVRQVRDEVVRDTVRLYAGECFACHTHDRRLYWHHVIPIARGGSNYLRNRVPLCLRCHHEIYPWLPVWRPGEQRSGEWLSIGQIAEYADLLIRRLA